MANARILRSRGIDPDWFSLADSGGGSIWDFIYIGDPMNGTADDDLMFGYADTSVVNNTIGGAGGDDFILGDIGNFFLTAGGESLATAFSLEVASTWTVDENPLFGDFTIPHATIAFEAVAGQEAYYSLSAGAGERITIDIDYATSSIGVDSDTIVQLLDSGGNLLATNNNASIGKGGLGSSSGLDSYLTFQATAAGSYFLRVYEPGSSPEFEGGENFLINVSVRGHAVTAPTAAGNDTLNGHEGDDQIFGVGGADSINGWAGRDFMHGGGGDDFLAGNEDNDTMRGGDGNDTLTDSEGSNRFDGGLGNDSLTGSGIFEFSGDGALAENDSVATNEDGIVSFAKSEVAVIFFAGSAQQGQRSVGFTSSAKIVGSNFDDVWNLSNISGNLDGGGGSDLLDYRFADFPDLDFSILWDFNAGETKVFNLDIDFFSFSNFERLIVAPNVTDIVRAGPSDNYIDTRNLDDAIEGEGGADTLVGGSGADLLDGGDGFDWASYETSAGVVANLADAAANTRDAAGDSYFDIEGLIGSITRDSLTGDKFANGLDGGDGVDTLIGSGGNDTLIGGKGLDTLTGGAGKDQFRLTSAEAADADRILDFDPAKDEIALDGAVFALPGGALNPARFVLGTTAGDANDRIIYNAASGKLWFDADGTGAGAQIQIATIANNAALSAGDFIVI